MGKTEAHQIAVVGVPSFTKKTRNTGKTPKYRKDQCMVQHMLRRGEGAFDLNIKTYLYEYS